MYIKQFDTWNTVKQKVEKEARGINARKGEVRWCALGVNVGMEIDGKGNGFTRPILVLRVIGNQLALIAPLSTKLKTIPGYFEIEFKGQQISVCANHVRIISQKRLYDREGKLSDKKFSDIQERIFNFLKM
jgi:mRNA interferase MazF